MKIRPTWTPRSFRFYDGSLMPPLSLIQYEMNGSFIFIQNSNLELKVFVEDSLIFTDYCVTNSFRDWITVFLHRLRNNGG